MKNFGFLMIFSAFIVFSLTRIVYGTVEVFKNPSLALYMTTIADATGSHSTSLVRELRMSFYLFLGADPNEPQYWGRSAFEEAVVTENINAIRKLTPIVKEDSYILGARLACVSSDYEILEIIFKARGERNLTPTIFCDLKE
ncbi:hypothetical protein [Alishewanella jeotgali]|uniref:Uncharacterized protein n=1 Tax=Alishewanella jeotgali KCTC 22429 TaxID=1129374 RepID=H3ZEV4_9ALTE|nr:hypothetical protein [Alishewanella jeotgali]EHR40906.1 hypothetical protein AJE_09444 [Alishewanella jeotgali KCTC 22429]